MSGKDTAMDQWIHVDRMNKDIIVDFRKLWGKYDGWNWMGGMWWLLDTAGVTPL